MDAVQTVGLRRYVEGAKNAHGNPIDSWAEPVDLDVYSIAPRFSNEPDPTRPAGVVVGLSLLAPPGTVVDDRDLVVIDGDDWKVEGELADWTRGPFGWAPGVSIDLKRAEG